MKKVTDFIFNLVHTFLLFFKIPLQSKKSKLSITKNNKSAILLANGPALKEVLNDSELLDKLCKIDTICVNFFYKTKYFLQLKPNNYIVSDPKFWMKNADETFIKQRNKFYEYLAKNVNWNMTFLIPVQAKKTNDWLKILSKNSNIKIEYFNVTAIEGFKKINHFLYKFKLGMPRSHNVSSYSTMVLLFKGYKKIGLLGVNHDWTKTIFVSENNETFLSQTHFYDSKVKPQKMDKTIDEKNQLKLHEMLFTFHLIFKSYFEINDYAKSINSKVYNLTKGSFIDAFERKSLINFLKL